GWAVAISNHLRSYLAGLVARTLKKSHDYGLALGSASGNHSQALGLVHIAGLTADESFIYFHAPAKFSHDSAVLHRQPNTVHHEPSGFLSNPDGAVNLVRADTVLAVGDHPKSHKPLVEADGRILKDGPDLNGKLLRAFAVLALPALLA